MITCKDVQESKPTAWPKRSNVPWTSSGSMEWFLKSTTLNVACKIKRVGNTNQTYVLCTKCKPRCFGPNAISVTDVLLSTSVARFTCEEKWGKKGHQAHMKITYQIAISLPNMMQYAHPFNADDEIHFASWMTCLVEGHCNELRQNLKVQFGHDGVKWLTSQTFWWAPDHETQINAAKVTTNQARFSAPTNPMRPRSCCPWSTTICNWGKQKITR